jgi:hypothetical protein
MKRTTIKIPDELDARLRHEAKLRGVTISELTREAIEVHLGTGGDAAPSRYVRHISGVGSVSSPEGDWSTRIEEYMAEGLDPRR